MSMPRLSALPVLAALLIFAPSASAATLTVDDAGDAGDANSAAVECATAGDVCTLRAAMEQAASPTNPGLDTIEFTLPDPTTIDVGTFLPTVGEDLTIAGPGAEALTVNRSAVAEYRIFTTTAGMISISGLTIKGGKSSGGGGINNSAVLTLDDVTVSNNVAAATSATSVFALGGGILSQGGSLTVKRSTVLGNSATGFSMSSGTAYALGGGIYVNGGALTVDQSLIAGNYVNAIGGGTATTNAQGGGIAQEGPGASVIKNSTVYENWTNAQSGVTQVSSGGGIWAASSAGTTATSDTIVGNYTTLNSNPAGTQGGNLASTAATVTVSNTILASSNSGLNCYGIGLGTVVDGGFNIVYPNDCPSLSTASHADPMLAFAFGEHGGPTSTFKLSAGSPAIDQGKNFPPAEPTDQRGFGRTRDVTAIANADDGTDIGAYEATTRGLTVTTPGSGAGFVSGTGIDCGGVGHTDCSENYLDGTLVTLNATPAGDSTFSGWSGGGCSGTGSCMLTMNAPLAVSGPFELIPVAAPIATPGGAAPAATGLRAAALKKCKKKKGAARKRCKKKANKLPV